MKIFTIPWRTLRTLGELYVNFSFEHREKTNTKILKAVDKTAGYIIDGKQFTGKELFSYASRIVQSGSVEDWRVDVFHFIRDFLDGSTPITQRTSGTTGEPKLLELRREAMLQSAKMTLDYFSLQPGNTALLCLPVEYIAGKMMVVRALSGGLNLLTVKPKGNPLETIHSPVDFAAMVPLQVFESLKDATKLKWIKKLIIGGGAIPNSLRSEINRLTEPVVYETFGMSETYTHFAVRRINGEHPSSFFEVLKGASVVPDERGCATVDIPGITEGRIITNDLVEMKSADSFEWLGRVDNVISSGGIKIIPEMLEEKIRQITGREGVVISLPDPRLGERLVLVVESASDDLPRQEWMDHFRKILKRYELPSAIYSVSELPRNRAGKVIRGNIPGIIAEQGEP